MNILAVLLNYPPRSRVGAWLTTHDYLAALAARGHRVDVVPLTPSRRGYVLDGVQVHTTRGWQIRLEPHNVPIPDVVVSHLGDQGQGAEYAERHGLPSVRMVHGHKPDNTVRLDEYPTRLAVFSSAALQKETAWDGPQLVAHPPIFADRYRVEPGCHVTQINLSPEKGGELLAYLATACHDVPFLAVRGGYGRQQVKGFPPNVEVIGTTEDVRDVYRRTRILLMPSERESYGRVAVEAACSGIPTIAHPCSGLVEAMGDAATWADRCDLGAWITAVRALRDPTCWAARSVDAKARTAALNPEQTITEVVEAIEALS